MYDLLIRNGTVVDGTGADRRVADVAVVDGTIVAVGPDLDGEAATTIDATGRLVSTRYDDVYFSGDGIAETEHGSDIPLLHLRWYILKIVIQKRVLEFPQCGITCAG